MPKGKKHTPEQIVRHLRNAEAHLPRDRDLRADLLPLEEPLRGHVDPGVAALEEAGGRSLPGQRPAQGAGRGKLLSPARRRRAAKHLQATFPISEGRTALVVSASRSTLRYQARLPDDEPRLLSRMEVLVGRHPRYGYRRIGDLLRRKGFRANPKRIYRLWKREGYREPEVATQVPPLGLKQEHLPPPERKNQSRRLTSSSTGTEAAAP